MDPSAEMLRQATRPNSKTISEVASTRDRRQLIQLPFPNVSFAEAIAIISMQAWPEATAGLREIGRVLHAGSRLALTFTDYSVQPRGGVPELVAAAGFTGCGITTTEHAFCVLAHKA